MVTQVRAPRSRTTGRRKAAEAAPLLPPAASARTDRLVELADHCGAARQLAEDMGESFIAYLLAMAVAEARMAMRRTTLSATLPARKKRRSEKPAS